MATVYPSIRPFPSVGRYNLATYDSNFRYSRLPTYKPEWRWTRRVIITEQSGNDLTDYQVLVTLTWKNFEFHKAEADGRDIRFVDPSTWRFLPYWIEKWDSENYLAKVWVKVPSIPANSTKEIYLLYGNPDATSESNGDNVFDFFDDFEGTDLDTTKWYSETTDYVVSNSEVSAERIHAKTFIAEKGKHVVEVKVKGCTNEADKDIGFKFLSDSETALGNCYLAGWNLAGTSNNVVQIGEYSPYNQIASCSYSWNVDTYYLARVWKSNDDIVHIHYEVYEDGSNPITCDSSATTWRDSGYVGFYESCTQNNCFTLDWFRVRKYADPEPKVEVR